MPETVTLELLAAQQQRVLDELGAVRVEMAAQRTEFVTIRDDITVLTAIVMRQENTLKAILDQLRTMTTQQHRLRRAATAARGGANSLNQQRLARKGAAHRRHELVEQ
jgi:hypothetical protein